MLVTGITCQTTYFSLIKGYRQYNTRFTEMFINNTANNMLFLGSSRMLYHVNPKIIDSICKTNSYNASIDGANLFEFKVTLLAYLEKHPTPDLLVLNLDLTSFGKGYFFNYNQYYPYLKNAAIKKALSENGYYNPIFNFLPFLLITKFDNLTRGNAVKGLTNKTQAMESTGEQQFKGFKTNGNAFITQSPILNNMQRCEITKTGKECLDKIIATCKEKKIKLIFTYAPEYNFGLQKKISNSAEILRYIDSTASINNIIFFKHDSLPMCTNPKLFANIGHLNTAGANAYSVILGNELNHLISSK